MMYKYNREDVANKIKIALGILFKNDYFLLENDVNERSISHKLAEYLQRLFPDYNVDCEYNRQFDDVVVRKKDIFFNEEEQRRFYPKTEEKNFEDNNAHTVFPDIIIHHRGGNGSNLLVVEVKKSSNRDDLAKERDILKLKKYKEKFQYDYTLFLEILVDKGINLENYKKIRVKLNGESNDLGCTK